MTNELTVRGQRTNVITRKLVTQYEEIGFVWDNFGGAETRGRAFRGFTSPTPCSCPARERMI